MPGVWCISVHLFNCKFLPEFAPERDPNTHRTLSIWTVATPDICESGFIESRSHSHMCEPSLREHILAPIDHVQYYAFKISKFPPPLVFIECSLYFYHYTYRAHCWFYKILLSWPYVDWNSAGSTGTGRISVHVMGRLIVHKWTYWSTFVQLACRVFPKWSTPPAIASNAYHCILTAGKAHYARIQYLSGRDSPIHIECMYGGIEAFYLFWVEWKKMHTVWAVLLSKCMCVAGTLLPLNTNIQ